MNIADQRVMSIFSAALECRTEAERSSYLDQECDQEPELWSRVQALLRAYEDAGRFLEPESKENSTATPVDAATVTELPSAAEELAVVAGRYQLLEMIGTGGMGTVWLAEQTEPVRRKVALKLIRPGMDTQEARSRFEAERQALAVLDHPNIAKVHDGGLTDEGRPYFVMELVRGVPVTDYCDRARLDVRDRLGLFIQICQAVQHAHQKGIIHRDLKPSNVLVTEHDPGAPGVVKVIDFGVAKAVGPHLTDDPVHTRIMQMVGTPLYMSPEQAELRGLDIDTRADIYSLGVLLYQLLTGTTPFDKDRFKEAGHDEVRRILREEEPPKPSARLSTLGVTRTAVSTNRWTDQRRLSRQCRGELDWMVMKALEKDRSRRYETASAFAADVERYLNNEPVAAGPPSALYKVRKFVRRHRGKVAAAGIFIGLLVVGVVGLAGALYAVDAERQRKENALTLLTEQQEETNRALASKSRGLDQAYSALRALTDDLVENVVARQGYLGEPEKAYLRKVANYFDRLAREHGDTSAAWRIAGDGQWLVAGIRDVLGEPKEAEVAYRAALAARLRLLAESPDNSRYRRGVADCHIGLAMQFHQTGRPQEAEASIREAIALLSPPPADFAEDPEACWLLARSHDRLGLVLRGAGRLPEAEAAHREALAVGGKLSNGSRVLAKGGPGTALRIRAGLAEINGHLGNLLLQTGRAPEAEVIFRDALAIRKKVAADFPTERRAERDLAGSYHSLGGLLFETGRIPDAEAAFRESITRQRKLAADFPLAPTHSEELANSLGALGTLLTQTNRARAAEEIAREALAIRRKLAADFPGTPKYRSALAAAHFDLGNVMQNIDRPQDAETAFRAAIELQTKLVGDSLDTPAVRHEFARSHNNLGNMFFDQRRSREAEAAYREALALEIKLTAEFPTVADYAVGLAGTYCNLGNLCQFQGQPAEAPEWYARAIATLELVVEKEPRLVKARLFLRNSHWGRADTLGKLNRHREALSDWDRALELSPPPQRPMVQMGRALGLVRAGETARATQAADELLAGAKLAPGILYDAACLFALAAAAVHDDAPQRERHAVRAVELLSQAQAQGYFRQAGRVEHLEKDDDLATLRERDDYRKLLADLQRTLPPKDGAKKP